MCILSIFSHSVGIKTDLFIFQKDKGVARVDLNPGGSFTIRFYKPKDGIELKVKGVVRGVIPYLTSVLINNQEYCTEPNVVSKANPTSRRSCFNLR